MAATASRAAAFGLAGSVGFVEKAIRSRGGALRAARAYSLARPRGRRAAAAASATVRVDRAEAAQPEPVVLVGRQRDAAALGLDAEEPARRRRDADRAAPVGAQRAGDHPGGDRRGAAAARPARAALRVPRIARRAPRLRLGEMRPQARARACSSCPPRWRRRRADGGRPRSPSSAGSSTSPVPCVVSSPATSMLSLTAIGTPSSGAVRRFGGRRLRGFGLGERPLGAHGAEGVDRRIEAGDALEARARSSSRAVTCAGAHELGQPGDARRRRVLVGGSAELLGGALGVVAACHPPRRHA